MGLDAVVRCSCFEQGRTTKPPVPREWIGVDEHGYLALLPEHEEDEEAQEKFEEWLPDCCPHGGVFASAFVTNWTGYQAFCEALERVGWEHFPVLQAELPEGNDGLTPPE